MLHPYTDSYKRKDVNRNMADTKTRSLILASAIKLFGERGKAAVSTADIARDARVNKALIFYHFTSKNELYRTAFLKQLREFVEHVCGRMSEVEPGLPAVETFVRSHIAMLIENKHMVRMIIRELLFCDDETDVAFRDFAEVFKTLRDDIHRSLLSASTRGQIRDVDPLQTIVSIVSLDIFYFLSTPLVRMLNPGVDSDQFEAKRIDHVVDLLMNGLRKQQE